jgi:hypothetical protein
MIEEIENKRKLNTIKRDLRAKCQTLFLAVGAFENGNKDSMVLLRIIYVENVLKELREAYLIVKRDNEKAGV